MTFGSLASWVRCRLAFVLRTGPPGAPRRPLLRKPTFLVQFKTELLYWSRDSGVSQDKRDI